jgi:hypothetical protein
MNFDDDELTDNDLSEETTTGSDDLLSDDNLRLPEDANPLVRLHAIRSWLARRQKETEQDIGMAALGLQQIQQEEEEGATRLRRREIQARQERVDRTLQALQDAQQSLLAYEEARELLEECVSHVTVSERLLVEYYLTLTNIIQDAEQPENDTQSARVQAFSDVLYRVERVGSTVEED